MTIDARLPLVQVVFIVIMFDKRILILMALVAYPRHLEPEQQIGALLRGEPVADGLCLVH